MATKRHLVMLAFMVLALGLSFSAGIAANSNTCDPADCIAACELMTPEECAKVCPPECIVICEGADGQAEACVVSCSYSGCSFGSTPSGKIAILDPTGLLSFNFAAGQGAEITK